MADVAKVRLAKAPFATSDQANFKSEPDLGVSASGVVIRYFLVPRVCLVNFLLMYLIPDGGAWYEKD
ncbi:MAG: hypothetical protein RR101_15370, partial [Burkholderiaceae bacterium]